jgi:hypothetical protein
MMVGGVDGRLDSVVLTDAAGVYSLGHAFLSPASLWSRPHQSTFLEGILADFTPSRHARVPLSAERILVVA